LNIEHRTSTRIALFGDIHLYSLRLWPWHLLSKRVLGQTNLWLNRRKRFSRQLVRQVTERIDSIAPDAVLCPGDLTTTATHTEFRMARHELADTFARFPTFVTPGNHDRYTFSAARHRRFEQYFDEQSARQWPVHRPLGEKVDLVAIDTARPNRIFDKGRLGQSQREAMKQLIDGIPDDHHLLVMGHYTIGTPPGFKPEKRHHALIDEAELIDALAAAERPMFYLHGHVHKPWCWRHPLATNVTVVNAGSPTHVDHHFPRGQGIWQIELGDSVSLTWHTLTAEDQWTALPIALPIQPGKTTPVMLSPHSSV